MPVTEFSTRVEWQKRANGNGAWISVGHLDRGPHFQCDYVGCMIEGPKRIGDFACTPPDWVIRELRLT